MIHATGGKLTAGFSMRAGWFAFLMVFASMLFVSAQAQAETRTLKLYFIHTKERAEITFKKNGRYQQDGLNKLNKFLRDWRRNEPTKMDPRLFDLVWSTYQKVGGRDYINVVSAYRSPTTNSMLRSRTRGVAKTSQHMLGKAMDWYLPGVKLATLRNAALKFEAGGVGYYPRSGSPFIHTDVGNVRHWPRMSRKELLAVFPDGKTMHIPTDGKPLPGYDQAVAAYESRKRSGGSIQVASSSSSRRSGKTLFGVLFGGGADEEEDSGESSVAVASAPTPARGTTRQRPAAAESDEDSGPAPTTTAGNLPGVALPTSDAPAPVAAPRPEAPVELTAEDNQALAFAVPVPLRRPDYAPAAATPEPSTLNALAADNSTLVAALPATRPQDSAAAIAQMIAANPAPEPEQTDVAQPQTVNALVPVPFEKPRNAPKQNDMMVASIVPTQRPANIPASVQAASAEDVIPVPDDDLEAIIRQSDPEHSTVVSASQPSPELPTTVGKTGGRVKKVSGDSVAQVASAAPQPSLRKTMLEAKGGDPVAMLDSGVVTTAKASKPRRQAHEAPKAMQVSSDVPERALSNEQVAETAPAVTPAVLRNETMRMAPTTVYVAGFQQKLPVADANKFTGKAVTFMQIAKFNPSHGS
ncbi:DUF882 domain-containing protein [Phyllobacterium sp. SB3]|uniref:DUF882 domain-containing protein n=1 Tax=Phyllobacterium sp. SB3 TaxID=3156073 RepID=UPI0032AED10F